MHNQYKYPSRLRWIILWILALCLVIGILCGVSSSVVAFFSQQSQVALHTEVSKIWKSRQEFLKNLDSIQLPEHISQETFDALKLGAQTTEDFSILDQYDPNQTITQDYVEQVRKLQNISGEPRYTSLLFSMEKYTEEDLKYFLEDPARYDFITHSSLKDSFRSSSVSLEEDLSQFPQLMQWDIRWGYTPYGESILAYEGSAPTCLSMAFAYLKKDPSLTPANIANFATTSGYYIPGIGTASSLMEDSANHYGVHGEGISLNQSSFLQAIEQGKIIVASLVMKNDQWEKHHFVVLYGHEGTLIKGVDPNSSLHTEKMWELSTILSYANAAWAYSKS